MLQLPRSWACLDDQFVNYKVHGHFCSGRTVVKRTNRYHILTQLVTISTSQKHIYSLNTKIKSATVEMTA